MSTTSSPCGLPTQARVPSTLRRSPSEGATQCDWRLEAPPALPTTLAPNAQLDLKVKFIAETGRRVHNGTLTITSNDPAKPQTVIQLAGWWQSLSENNQEPSLQQVVDTFGYKTRIVNSGQNLNQKGLFAAVGDEILSPYWRRADTAQPVAVRQLVGFHTYPNTATIYWYPKGSTATSAVVKMDGQDAQTFLPRKNGSTAPASSSFTPSSTVFGFKVDSEWSDWRKNDGQKDLGNGCAGTIPQDCGHHVRFWPVKDRSGTVIPNTYLMAMDYSGINYDFNDNVYLISNIAPDAQPSYRLNVAGSAYSDTSGNAWTPDSGFYVPTDAKSEGGTSHDIANTEDDPLYQTYRALLPNKSLDERVLVYNLPVPSGDYDVRLHFAEIYWDVSGKRVFDVVVEGATVLDNFDILLETNKFSALVKTFPKVTVSDGMLTLRFKAETDYGAVSALEVVPAGGISPCSRPPLPPPSRANGATKVFRNTAIAADVNLPNGGAGVDGTTLSASTVKLYRSSDNAGVPGTVNTTGGGDAIVFQPSVLLAPNTNYTFAVTRGVKDEAGAAFTPFTMSFTTGTATSVKTDPAVSFSKTSVYNGSALSSLLVGPDGKLYGTGLDGVIHRWQIGADGTLSGEQTFRGLAGKVVIGAAFDPNDKTQLYLWTTANEPLYPQPAPDFSGKLYKLHLQGINLFDSDLQLYLTGLPRSAKDHLSNSLTFGPDGLLYMTQGGNSAMGAPDSAWYNRPERLLNAAVLQIDPRRTSGLPINVQTEPCDEHCQGSGTSGNYDPYAANAPVKIYASGVRNAYDLVWHSSGKLYAPTNGSAAGGNTPDNPNTPQNEGLFNVSTQDDFLFKVEQGGYYGHPNPKRGEYILNGGNPTSGDDPAEVVATGPYVGYPVGTRPDPNYRGFAYNFGRNRSPDGVIEYKSSTFGGKLKGRLLVVEYSGGDDVLALPLGSDGNVVRSDVIQVVAGLTDPVDLVEDTHNGNLYIAELVGGGVSGRISLLRVGGGATNSPPAVSAGADQSVVLPAAANSAVANLDATVSDDGLPNNTLTTMWRKVVGPGSVSFGNAAAVDTSARFSAVGTYILELTASDGALSNSARTTIDVQKASSQSVTSLVLVNADTDRVIRQLVDGELIDYTALGTSNITVRADTDPAMVGSVLFTLDGGPYRVENVAPYTLAGDGSNGADYYPVAPPLTLGKHRLSATPYSGSSTSGSAGTTLTVNFTVTVGAPTNTPPTADFSSSCTNLGCTFSDSSADTDGSVTAWKWSFGDGVTASTRNPSHVYGVAGTYTVTLSVTDNGGATSAVSKTLPVTAATSSGPAVASFTLVNADTDRDIGLLTEGSVVDTTALRTQNLSVRANSGSGTVGSVLFVLDGSPYRVENIAPYALAGDGSNGNDYYPVSPALAPGAHTLAATAYTVRSAGGSAGTTLTVNFTVRVGAPTNTPPTAGFSSSCTGLSCAFSDSSTDTDGSVTAWKWSFGDGATSTIRNPSHTYGAAGTYTVNLTVRDNGGATNTLVRNVSVTAPASSGPTVTSFSLINADTDKVVRQLVNGDVVDYAALGTRNLSIRANPSPATVGSISFVLDGSPYRIENFAPYSLAGEVWRSGPTSEYYAIDPALSLGSHTLTATPSSEKYGGGSGGTALTLTFTVR